MNEQWLEIANVFDPITGEASSMPAWRWTPAQRRGYEAAAKKAGLVITYTVTAR